MYSAALRKQLCPLHLNPENVLYLMNYFEFSVKNVGMLFFTGYKSEDFFNKKMMRHFIAELIKLI